VRNAALVLASLGLFAVWFLPSPGEQEEDSLVATASAPVVHLGQRHPARPLWLEEQADLALESESPEFEATDVEVVELATPESEASAPAPALQVDSASALDHEAMHAEAWDDLVDKLVAAGEDPGRFIEAMELASEQRWAVAEE